MSGRRQSRSKADEVYPLEGSVANKHRCGWCITGDHDKCIVEVFHETTRQTSICPCDCTKKKPKAVKTRRSTGS